MESILFGRSPSWICIRGVAYGYALYIAGLVGNINIEIAVTLRSKHNIVVIWQPLRMIFGLGHVIALQWGYFIL